MMRLNQTTRFQSASAICATLRAYIRLLKRPQTASEPLDVQKLVMSRTRHLSHKNAVTAADTSRKSKSVDVGAAVPQEVI